MSAGGGPEALAAVLIAAALGFFGGRKAGHGEGLAEGRNEALRVALQQPLPEPPERPTPITQLLRRRA